MSDIYQLTSLREAATRPEFYRLLDTGLKTMIINAYEQQAKKSTYEQIVDFQTSDKDKEKYPTLGSTPLPRKVLEGQPFPENDFPKDDRVEVTNFKYGEIISITREMIDDDQTKEMKNRAVGLGMAHKKYEDKAVYSIINANGSIYDGASFFTINHPGYTGGGNLGVNDNIYTNVTLSANAIATALGMISRWVGHTTDDLLDVQGRSLVVPVSLKRTAKFITESDFLGLAYAAATLGPAATIGQARNVLKQDALNVIASPRLDTTSTTDWYIRTDFPGFFFQWRDRLDVRRENDSAGEMFERDVFRTRSRARFGLRIVNWRCMMKVS